MKTIASGTKNRKQWCAWGIGLILLAGCLVAGKGDVDGTEGVTLSDVTTSLQVAAGEAPTLGEGVAATADVNGDGRIGVHEAIFAMNLITSQSSGVNPPGFCLNTEEQLLAGFINQYRASADLAQIPVSRSLSTVAQWHVWDLNQNAPDTGDCNLHSWSDAKPDLWNPVCYTPDHANAEGMWNKPKEITDYPGNGYENAYFASGGATAEDAFNSWKSDPGHDNIMLEKDIWEGKNWQSMGVGVSGNHAVVWFGAGADPEAILPCE